MSANESKWGRNFIVILLISLLSAAVGAAGFWYFNDQDNISLPFFKTAAANSAETTAAPANVTAAPIFLELQPFTFTLRNQTASRIFYVGFTLQLKDEASKERLLRYLPIARSRIITDLGDIPPESLNMRETKDAIRTVVAKSLEMPFGSENHPQLISDVLINTYVVQ